MASEKLRKKLIGQDSWDRIAGIGQLGHRDRIAGIGQLGQYRRNRTA
jgi:hypothetical protein